MWFFGRIEYQARLPSHVMSQIEISRQVLLSKHVKCQTNLPKESPQWEVAVYQDPINLHKSPFRFRISFDQTAGNLPRVVSTPGSSETPHQQEGFPVGMLSGLELKLDDIWKTMPETFSKSTQNYSFSYHTQMSNHPIDLKPVRRVTEGCVSK